MSLNNLSNNQLIRLCASEPTNRNAWLEFYSRFDDRIWTVIYRECREKQVAHKPQQFDQVVQDLVQDVYVRLVEKKCQALRDFQGASENSIYMYLGVIARNIVRNYLAKMKAHKRPVINKSIDDFLIDQIKKDESKLVYVNGEEGFSVEILKEEIDEILERCLSGQDKERNELIFKLYLYEDFSPEEIFSQLTPVLSVKRIRNIIGQIKRVLRDELLEQRFENYSVQRRELNEKFLS